LTYRPRDHDIPSSLHRELHSHDDAAARSTFLVQILVLAAMGDTPSRTT
jgi:hypothetical protein